MPNVKRFSTHGKFSKEKYFQVLGYQFLYSSRSKPIGKNVEIRRIREMMKVLSKIQKLYDRRNRDTSYRKEASFKDVCSNELSGPLKKQKTKHEFENVL